MRLSQLNGLILIHQYGSISKAAQESFQSQSALSVSIKELEEELGHTILIRTKKGVTFTEYGLQVLEHANRIFAEVALIRELEGDNRTVCGNVSLGTSSYYGNILSIQLLLTLKEQYPGINLQIRQDKNMNVISDVLLGNLDLGLLQVGVLQDTFYYPKEFLKSRLEFHQLFMRPIKIAVGEHHPLRAAENLTMVDLCSYRYITNKNLEEDVVYQHLKACGYHSEVFQVEDSITRSLINSLNGMNAVLDVGLEAGNRQYQDKLYPLEVQDFSGAYAVGWIHKAQPLSLAEEKIIELLEQQCADLVE